MFIYCILDGGKFKSKNLSTSSLSQEIYQIKIPSFFTNVEINIH